MFFQEALFYSRNGRYQEALKIYDKSLLIKPTNILALINKGNTLKMLRRFNEALEIYNKALEISPNNPDVLYNIASVYSLLKNRDKMLCYLSHTFQNDGQYKDEAINDISFKEYWHDPAFKNLTEA